MTSQDTSDSPAQPHSSAQPQVETPQFRVQIQILSVIRRHSPMLPTTRYNYNDKGEMDSKLAIGAEWEEVEFGTISEEKPIIQISNIVGSVYLIGGTGKLLINNPDLFGTYKAGDIINFMPITGCAGAVADADTLNRKANTNT